MLYEKNIFLQFNGENRIKVNTDFIVLDPDVTYGNIIMASILDARSKIDKIHADLKKNTIRDIDIYNRDTEEYIIKEINELKFNSFSVSSSITEVIKKSAGKFVHMMLTTRIDKTDYIYNFDNELLAEIIFKKMVNVCHLPCKLEHVQKALAKNPNLCKEMVVITKNENLKNVKVYRFFTKLFEETLLEVATENDEKYDTLFDNYENNFTKYINDFKEQIVENLYEKLEFFYDKNDVPEYVTTFPRPLPNSDMKKALEKISQHYLKKPFGFSSLNMEEMEYVFNAFHALDKQGKIPRNDKFNPDYSKQYELWAAGMKILESERFLYLSLTMGAGKTASSLKINKYTCRETLKNDNHLTFILAPQSTITQWVGEIDLIEKGIGHTKDDYDIVFLKTVDDLIEFRAKYTVTKPIIDITTGKVKKYKTFFDKTLIPKPTYILSGKETFKLSQLKRPAFNLKLDDRIKPSKDIDLVTLTCPNCGQFIYIEKNSRKHGKQVIPLNLRDYFEMKKGGKTPSKVPKKSNMFCTNCNKKMAEMKTYIEEEAEAKSTAISSGMEYKKFYMENPNDTDKRVYPKTNTLWGIDYNPDNYIKNKLYFKMKSPISTYKNPRIVSRLKQRKERFDRIRELFKLKVINPTELTTEEKAIGYKPKDLKIKTKKVAITEYLKKRVLEFDTTIIDEAHEGNSADSLIGTAQKLIFKFSKKVILLSGTANNGYASSLHNLLSSAMPDKLIADGTFNRDSFISKYGILQAIRPVDETGKLSGKTSITESDYVETEGINPVVFTRFLAKNFIMINTLKQLDLPLPELIEEYVPVQLDNKIYKNITSISNQVATVSPLMDKMLVASTYKNYINNPYNWSNFEVKGTDEAGNAYYEEIIVDNVDRESMEYTAKDYELLRIVKNEKREKRKVFIFSDFINGGEYIKEETWEGSKKPKKVTINDRLVKLLQAHGIKCTVITTSTAKVIDRKNWIEAHKDDYDVFICQPQLVNVGLNLVFCPTYIVYTPYYRYDIISQATRRGYRANSTVENRVFHLYFSKSCEETIIDRYQRKLAEAKAIEGDFNVKIEEGKNVRTLSKVSAEIVGA